MRVRSSQDGAAWARPGMPSRANALAALLTALGVATALVAAEVVGGLGVLTWSVLLGAVLANAHGVPASVRPALTALTRRALRIGIVLLGFSLSLVSIASLGAAVILLVVATLVATLLLTMWLGLRLGVGRPRSLLIATGFAICGASAIAAMEENAEADEDDVAVAIAMVTLCGTVAMLALPLVQAPLGLSDTAYGIWAGASVHEVAQVVAAAGPAGTVAVAVAVVVKLTRVVCLAPIVGAVSYLRRRSMRTDRKASPDAPLPPLVPLFVIGFLLAVAVRSTGLVPEAVLRAVEHVQVAALSAALFGLGTGVVLAALLRSTGPALRLALASTAVVASVSLAGVLVVV